MALTCSGAENESESLCPVHDIQRSERALEMTPCHRDQCICPRELAETSYLDPRLLTAGASSENDNQYVSAHGHNVLQLDSTFVATEDTKTRQSTIWDLLPYPCFSPDGRGDMTASTPSSSSNRSPRYDEVLQPILTVSEERHLRRKAQNREA